MFFVPFLHLKVQNWSNKKKQLLNLYSTVFDDCKFSSDGIYTNYYQDNCKIIGDIQYIFYEELKEFSNRLQFNSYFVKIAWFEESDKNVFHGIHNHGALGYSSVCFINFNEDKHIPTKFIAPFCNFVTGITLEYIPENITEGSIIFFPSIINHFTEPNHSNEKRLVVSFNLEVK